ncbi:MAG TPA: hypothetical protein VF765_07375 [Polyangiaceae bacterium]
MTSNASPEALDASAQEGEFGLEQALELAAFFGRAPRRHRALAFVTVAFTAIVGIAVAVFWPRSYSCNVRILAQRNLVLPALDNPAMSRTHDADNPTKNAADAILRRDNVVAMVRQLDLLERWQTTRQPILRLKDKLTSWGPPRPEEERQRDLVDLLDKRLIVYSDDASITIQVDWPDRQTAFDIVSFLQKNFLEARYDSNVNVITEAINILEDRAKPAEAEVDAALADLTKVEADRLAAQRAQGATARPTSRGGRGTSLGIGSTGGSSSSALPVLSGDAQELEDVRRRIRILEEERDRQVAQAQSQLTDARSTLGPMHPTVLALNEKLEQLGKPSPELAALAAKERELVGRLAVSPPAADTSTPPPSPPPARPSAPVAPTAPIAPATSSDAQSALPMFGLRDDPQIALAMTRLQAASSKYNELLSRIEAARIELDVTRAAFKYQYTVVRPPELARGPSKPNVPLVLLLTAVLTALAAFLVPGLLDLWRGRILEDWQVVRQLKIPLLGELTSPPDR